MSFLAPLGLLLGALAAPLVALYILKIRRRKVRVPSTLLWREFARTEKLATPFERFRRNLLLLLQLLVLAAVVLAFARPFLQTDAPTERSLVLLIDTSASMNARDVDPDRIGAARDLAIETIDALGPDDEVMVVAAGPRTEVVLPFTRDQAAARAAVGAIEATEAEGSLRDALQLALSLAKTRSGTEIAVLSDGGVDDLHDVPVSGATVRFQSVGRSSSNAGIVALDLRSAPASDLDRQLFTTVQAFGDQPMKASVEVYLDGKLEGLRTEDLAPGRPASVVFDLPAAKRGLLEVRLSAKGDVLPTDDVAYAVIDPATRRRVVLYGVDALTARALRTDPRLSLTVADKPFDPEVLKGADAAIFGSEVPASARGVDQLVLGPIPGSPVTFGGTAERPEILGWRRTHPVQRFVTWDGVFVRETRVVGDAAGLGVLVESDAGPLLLAGEHGGARVVQLAFDPYQSDLPLRVAWPVLVLNSVGWLTEDAGQSDTARVVAAGRPFVRRVPEDAIVTVKGPTADEVRFEVADALLRVQGTERVGVYEVSVGGEAERFAANLHSLRESDVRPRPDLDLGGDGSEVMQAGLGGRRELWRPLVMIALLVLLAEWFLYNRRRWA